MIVEVVGLMSLASTFLAAAGGVALLIVFVCALVLSCLRPTLYKTSATQRKKTEHIPRYHAR